MIELELPPTEQIKIVQKSEFASFVYDSEEERRMNEEYIPPPPLTETEKYEIIKKDMLRESKRLAQSVGALAPEKTHAVFTVEAFGIENMKHIEEFVDMYRKLLTSEKQKKMQVQFIFPGNDKITLVQFWMDKTIPFDQEWYDIAFQDVPLIIESYPMTNWNARVIYPSDFPKKTPSELCVLLNERSKNYCSKVNPMKEEEEEMVFGDDLF